MGARQKFGINGAAINSLPPNVSDSMAPLDLPIASAKLLPVTCMLLADYCSFNGFIAAMFAEGAGGTSNGISN